MTDRKYKSLNNISIYFKKELKIMSESKKKNIDEKFCSDCGEIIKIKAEICPKCGIRQLFPPSLISNIFPNEKIGL